MSPAVMTVDWSSSASWTWHSTGTRASLAERIHDGIVSVFT